MNFGSTATAANTPFGFWAVKQARTEVPWTPNAAKVFKSAWMPAPPPESEPATVRAMGSVRMPYLYKNERARQTHGKLPAPASLLLEGKSPTNTRPERGWVARAWVVGG